MKKLVFSACALTLTGGTVVANDSDWAQLDQDVQALSASVQGLEGTGINFGGRIRAIYENSSDVPIGTGDLGGFSLYNARLYAHGTTASDIGYRLEYDFAEANLATFNTGGLFGINGLLDAYIDIPVVQDISIRAGQFRGVILRESLIDSGNLFFVDRSINAALFAGRRNGLAISGQYDAFEWAVTLQNGLDGVGDDLFYAVQGSFDFLGEGMQAMEGAFGASEEMEGSAGISYFDDSSTVLDSAGYAFEAGIASSQFSANLSAVSLGDAIIASNVDLNERIPVLANVEPDSTPWSVGATFMLTQPSSEYGAWEIGLRYQDMDDSISSTIIDAGVNYYVDGHNMKYILNYTSFDSDPGTVDLIRLGVNAAF